MHLVPTLFIFDIFKDTFLVSWLETEHVLFAFFGGGDSGDLPLAVGDFSRFRGKRISVFSAFLLRSLSNRTLKGFTAV